MQIMKMLLVGGFLLLLTACSASTMINSKAPDATIIIVHNSPFLAPNQVQKTYSTTSFGNYRFKVSKDGADPMYGILPLKFNPGYLVSDILFFDVGLFFNLREVYPCYEFSPDEGIVRYKKSDNTDWLIYRPTPMEIESAEKYYQY